MNNLRGLFIFSNYIRGRDPILDAGPSEKSLIVDHPKKDLNEQDFKR